MDTIYRVHQQMASYFPDGVFHDETNAYPRIPPTKVACLKASEKLEHPIISEPTNTTSFGRHKALDWWVKHCIQWESNPPPEENITIFGDLGGSQDLNLRIFPLPTKFQRLRTSLWTSPTLTVSPWCFRNPRHWEVALKAGPFTELNKS